MTIRRALILSLGEFDQMRLPSDQAADCRSCCKCTGTTADPGLHGAAEWLLRQWKQDERLKESDEEWEKEQEQRTREAETTWPSRDASAAEAKPVKDARWYVNGQGQTMVVIPGPVEFLMGSPPTEEDREGGPEGKTEKQVERRIGRSFAIAAKAVTVEQFQKFRPRA